jgi:hypothetical protein
MQGFLGKKRLFKIFTAFHVACPSACRADLSAVTLVKAEALAKVGAHPWLKSSAFWKPAEG